MSRFFGPIAQAGYVVRDVDRAMEHWAAEQGGGLHHWCFFTDSYSVDYQHAIDRGARIGHEGDFGADSRFAYFRADPQLGAMIELAELNPPMSSFFDVLQAAARDWDGVNLLFGGAAPSVDR